VKKSAKAATRWILLTGLSGSGKTTALKVLEDQGFSAIDNLPVQLLPSLIHLLQKTRVKIPKLVLGMDARGKDFLNSYQNVIQLFKEGGMRPEILFFDCNEKVLIRRFSESRRPHPLRKKRETLSKAIAEEKRILQPLREMASQVFDTSNLNIHQLKISVHRYLSRHQEIQPLNVNLISFGFKMGVPADADMIFDARFLKNPFFEPSLKNRLGTTPSIKKYVGNQKEAKVFMTKVSDLLSFLLPKFQKEGKTTLNIGFGCTGGKHRSVALVEILQEKLSKKNWEIAKIHRDLEVKNLV